MKFKGFLHSIMLRYMISYAVIMAVLFVSVGIYINDNYVTMQELLIQVQMKLQANPGQAVVIKADKEVFHGNFIKLLDELKKVGVTKFLIGANKKND